MSLDLNSLINIASEAGNIVSDIKSIKNTVQDIAQPHRKFDLNSFKSNVVHKDPALTSHYYTTIPNGDAAISMSCIGLDTPGTIFNTVETRRYGVGPTYSYPTDIALGTIQMSFIADSKGKILDFFHSWTDFIFDKDNSKEMFYVSEYKKNYVRDLTIDLYSRKKDAFYTFKLFNAWPVSVGNLQLTYANSDLLRVPVMFKFDTYKGVPTIPSNLSFLSSVNLPIVGSVANLLKIPTQIQDIQSRVNSAVNGIESFIGGI